MSWDAIWLLAISYTRGMWFAGPDAPNVKWPHFHFKGKWRLVMIAYIRSIWEPHMIRGTGNLPTLPHKSSKNVGKYTIPLDLKTHEK